MLAIIDYEMGNVKSIKNAFELLGEEIIITDEKNKISDAEAIILPGVGAFSEGMRKLERKNLLPILETEVLEKKKPYLGICLGLEFLAKKSFEGGETNGFGWIDATVKKIIPQEKSFKVPHMGWDDSLILNNKNLFKEIDIPTFYFTHSYYVDVNENEKSIITSVCDYGDVKITSSIEKNNIFAVQFHPEKSQSMGLKLLKNFIDVNLC
jgi:imidazole glycerol-phosphate synthase subunit HisH